MTDSESKDLVEIKSIANSELYAKQKWRYLNVQESFEKRYKHKPTHFVRAPGRVNVIGEHIDYAEFGVLPAAISHDIIIGLSITENSSNEPFKVSIANTKDKYPAHEFTFDAQTDISVDNTELLWSNYVVASFGVVLKKIKTALPERSKSMSLMFNGNVPAGSGLSSSAGMTCASTIAALLSLDSLENTSRREIVNLAVSAEHLCSISCGGMDQAASLFGDQNSLVHVEFLPNLTPTPLPLPSKPPVELVIANSLVVADKHLTSKFNYNLRLVEVRVAAALLAQHLELDSKQAHTLKRVTDVRFSNATSKEVSTKEYIAQLEQMLETVQQVFGQNEQGFSWSEVLQRLGDLSEGDFKRRFHPNFEIETDRFQLCKRARHVFNEAKRVYQFRDLLESQDEGNDEAKMNKLGQLMNESHDSCRDDYNCSCPELDQLVELGRKFGTLGSRLTGAGFGGCTVHLVPASKVAEFIQSLREDFYSGISVATVNEALFSTQPARGALVLLNSHNT